MQSATSPTTSDCRSHAERALPTLRVPSSLKASDEIRPRQRDCRRQAKEKSRADGNRERDEQHGRVEANLLVCPELGRRERQEQRHRPVGQRDAERRSGDRKQDALGQQLTDDATAAGAKRGAHRDLASTAGGASQQQVGGVRARDHQQQPDGPEDGQKRRADASRKRRLERLEARRQLVGPNSLGKLSSHGLPGRGGLFVRLREGPAGRKPRRHAIVEAAARASRARPKRNVQIHGWNGGKRRRHDADHDVGPLAEEDGRADDGGIAAKLTPPEAVAEDGGERPACLIVFSGESAAEDRPNAEHVEVILRDRHRPDELGVASGH